MRAGLSGVVRGAELDRPSRRTCGLNGRLEHDRSGPQETCVAAFPVGCREFYGFLAGLSGRSSGSRACSGEAVGVARLSLPRSSLLQTLWGLFEVQADVTEAVETKPSPVNSEVTVASGLLFPSIFSSSVQR